MTFKAQYLLFGTCTDLHCISAGRDAFFSLSKKRRCMIYYVLIHRAVICLPKMSYILSVITYNPTTSKALLNQIKMHLKRVEQ